MRILTRYILREIVTHAGIGTAVFTFVLFMGNVGRILELVVRNSAPLPSIAQLIFLTLPTALTVTIPMGVLVGILIGLSRLAADSEVTAMRASGFGVGVFLRPVSLLALTAWIVANVNTVLIAPRSAAALDELQAKLKSTQASFEVEPRVFYEDFPKLVLYVSDVVPESGFAVWRKIFVADISNPSAPVVSLAEQGTLVSQSNDELALDLRNGYTHEGAPRDPTHYSITQFQETAVPIELPSVDSRRAKELAPIPELPTRGLYDQRKMIEAHPGRDTAEREWNAMRWRWYSTELQRRFALPAACLVLAVIGVPLGLSAKKGGKATGFVLTIALVFIYYFISLGGVSMSRLDKVPPPVGVWMANALFLISGLILLWRANRRPIDINFRGVSERLKRWMHLRRSNGDSSTRIFLRKRVGASFPRILDDYVLRDFLIYLALVLVTFIILTLVFNFFELLNDIVRNRVPLITVGWYLVTLIPPWTYLIAPLCVLLAVLITLGLMEKANEVTAMKASGISIYRVVTPVIVLAAAIATGLFFFNEYYLPSVNRQQEALRNVIKGKPAQTFLRPDRMWIFGKNSTIYYYELFDADRNSFGNISIFEFDPSSFALNKRIFAARAHWSPELNRFVFEDGWIREFNGTAIKAFKVFDVSTFAELGENPDYFKKEIKQYTEMNSSQLSRYIQDMQQSGFDVVRLKVQWQKKFAYPIITLVMAVLAVPFSLRAARRGALTGVAVALGIAVVYFLTSGLFEAMGNLNQLPPALAAWAPDLLFALAGGYMILKVPT